MGPMVGVPPKPGASWSSGEHAALHGERQVLVDAGGQQVGADAVAHVVGGDVGQRGRRRDRGVDRGAVVGLRLPPVGAAAGVGQRVAQRGGRGEHGVDAIGIGAGQQVERPRRLRGTAQLGHPGGLVPVALGSQPAGQRGPGGDELGRVDPVQVVGCCRLGHGVAVWPSRSDDAAAAGLTPAVSVPVS